MKYSVDYKIFPKRGGVKSSKRPFGDLKIQGVDVVPLGRSMFYIYIYFNLRDVEISSYGSGGTLGDKRDPLYETITFEIPDAYHRLKPTKWAEVTFYPETKAECDLDLFGQISKDSYSGVMVPHRLISRKWDEYCGRRHL